MCRISGIVNTDISSARREEMVRGMCDLQKYGGPDGEGIYISSDNHVIFGHRRLALLDLSPAGNQPMRYKDYLSLTFNGEIYNFKSIKSELSASGHRFKSDSDSEVILAAYDEWGVHAFQRFNGMFAFALHDERVQKVFLVRDPSGIKPLYYSVYFHSLVFASELKAFRAVDLPFAEEPDWKVLLMAYGHIPEPHTTLREVKMLPKGCYLCYSYPEEKAEIFSFSHYDFSANNENSRSAVIEKLRTLLKDSVQRHLLADAPVGIFLSGGLDSSILYSLAVSSDKSEFRSLSVYFDEAGFSEKKYQDLVLKKTNTQGNQYRLSAEHFESFLPSMIEDMDMPSCDGLNTWIISKYARESGLKAVLSGVGADELFGGYPSFSRMKTAEGMQRLPDFLLHGGASLSGGKFSRISYLSLCGISGIYLFLRGHFDPAGIARYLEMDESEVWRIIREKLLSGNPGFLKEKNKASWMELNLYMQNQLLRDADVMSMKHGVEVRVPFLDNEFIRYTLGIKESEKFTGNFSKQLLIDAFGDLLPSEVWNRPKMGFSLPYSQWLRNSAYVHDVMGSKDKLSQKALRDFKDEKISWSRFLSLFLIQNHAFA